MLAANWSLDSCELDYFRVDNSYFLIFEVLNSVSLNLLGCCLEVLGNDV